MKQPRTLWNEDEELRNHSARFQMKVMGDEAGAQELGQEGVAVMGGIKEG